MPGANLPMCKPSVSAPSGMVCSQRLPGLHPKVQCSRFAPPPFNTATGCAVGTPRHANLHLSNGQNHSVGVGGFGRTNRNGAIAKRVSLVFRRMFSSPRRPKGSEFRPFGAQGANPANCANHFLQSVGRGALGWLPPYSSPPRKDPSYLWRTGCTGFYCQRFCVSIAAIIVQKFRSVAPDGWGKIRICPQISSRLCNYPQLAPTCLNHLLSALEHR